MSAFESAAARPDPRAFAARLRRLIVAGTIVAFGTLWALVASHVVGVTARAANAAQQPAPVAVGQGASPYSGSYAQPGGSYAGTGGNGGFFGGAANPGLGPAGNQAPVLGSGGS